VPDIWSKLDEAIFEWRWYIAAGLIGLSLIGAGTYLFTNGNQLFRSTDSGLPATSSQIPSTEEIAGEQTVSGPININTASQTELESLPGIGPVLAERIIDYREKNGPFKTKEALKNVKGIGDKTFADLADKITIE